ncbi:TetR/AcrR family transcriptional regulator [Oceanicoccus sagamiensis]|uniref:HTH tetR-type domain-containing protein n=1 Tax=Oceanicoccus sagamiensis TaxID=716816 RepID=A0A1X9NDY0_9GAMM|nr:TetR family transcriptional regulator [Oceanicoccus sagamiensis]ARN75264.1 hypothetical protein BST96_14765 [Oceanicoccus sagamiensis]
MSNNDSATAAKAPKKRTRRTQERTEITRAKVLEAATRIFSEQGFEGVSIRDIENAAGVQRGLVAYHFDDKDNLWKTVVDATFGLMRDEFTHRQEIMKELTERDRLAFVVRFYVRFHAKHPELSRLMSQEARQHSWRIDYLTDNHIRPAAQLMEKLVKETQGLDRDQFIHWYYIMVSASSTIFSFAPECELLFGVDSRTEIRVEKHADMLVDMLFGKMK